MLLASTIGFARSGTPFASGQKKVTSTPVVSHAILAPTFKLVMLMSKDTVPPTKTDAGSRKMAIEKLLPLQFGGL